MNKMHILKQLNHAPDELRFFEELKAHRNRQLWYLEVASKKEQATLSSYHEQLIDAIERAHEHSSTLLSKSLRHIQDAQHFYAVEAHLQWLETEQKRAKNSTQALFEELIELGKKESLTIYNDICSSHQTYTTLCKQGCQWKVEGSTVWYFHSYALEGSYTPALVRALQKRYGQYLLVIPWLLERQSIHAFLPKAITTKEQLSSSNALTALLRQENILIDIIIANEEGNKIQARDYSLY